MSPVLVDASRYFTGRGLELYQDQAIVAGEWPSPVGLSLGILSVIVGQALVMLYFFLWRNYCKPTPIQQAGAVPYSFAEAVRTHLAEPGGFLLMGGYLCGTWMFNLMPRSYYSFQGGIEWQHVLTQLMVTDFVQYLMHYLEHKAHPLLYKHSHKPHHRFINPRWADAFNGSAPDTILMILIPLFTSANVVHCNVWSYMAFGTIYSGYLTMIHSEYTHPWDSAFRKLGIITAGDHHVHHSAFPNINDGLPPSDAQTIA
ncbi:hypothetical protein CYMTET_27685 [Cymbomonas tetramitiformis]|uniref:Fatty acid hydroxylase domain-containing protein n=1 Tax=Cymbomonas tetramitiformis TaxID=36881 RepID=A0AAE0KWY4_9CHLO|nr:hypothetical protein CYMTET_27685 [Cymbomonas tetramitiformis]